MTREGYMDIIVCDKEGGDALKVERIFFDSVIEALLEMQMIKIESEME